MPHSVPVSKLMIPRNEWPQLRAEATIADAIKALRIVTEDRKLEHGHSTPLVLDDNYDLLGFVDLSDLLKSVRQFVLAAGASLRTGRGHYADKRVGRTLCGNSGRERRHPYSPGYHDGPRRVVGAGDERGEAQGAHKALGYIQHGCGSAV